MPRNLFVRVVVRAAALALLLAACGGEADSGEGITGSSPYGARPGLGGRCSDRPPAPVRPHDAIAIARQHGVDFLAMSGCISPSDSAAVANSIGAEDPRSEDERQQVIAQQGFILCSFDSRARFGDTVKVIRYEGEEETDVRALNVLCAIYPTRGQEDEQIGRVRAIVEDLARTAAQGP